MAQIEIKNFDSPDETRPFEGKGKADVLNIGGQVVGKAVFEPGWQWSKHIKPIAGTASCEASHVAYIISGRMKVVMDDGDSIEAQPGDFLHLESGARCRDVKYSGGKRRENEIAGAIGDDAGLDPGLRVQQRNGCAGNGGAARIRHRSLSRTGELSPACRDVETRGQQQHCPTDRIVL